MTFSVLLKNKMSAQEDALEDMSSTDEMEECSSTSYDSDEDWEYEGKSGYTCEPEYTKTELEKLGIKAIESDGDEAVSSNDRSNEDLDSSRLENLHWCTCGHCCIMPSLVESKCCRECANLIEDKLDHVKCVAEHEEFETLCLNKIVLNTAFIQYRRYKNNYNLVKQMNNKYVNNISVIYLTLFLLLLLLIKDFFLTHLLLRLVFIRSFVFLFLSVS